MCSLYHGAQGVMLVYDQTKQQTFDNIPNLLDELVSEVSPSTVIMLIGVLQPSYSIICRRSLCLVLFVTF